MANTRKSERSKGKTPRVPFGGFRLKTQLSEEDMAEFKRRKMHTRWFNDEPGRINRARAAGYDYVDPENATSLGQGALHRDGSDPESAARVSIVVSKEPPPLRAYLMEISMKFHKEDQAKKEERNQMVDDALAAGSAGGVEVENKYGPGMTYSR